jgi:hypothetical protein
MLRPVSNKKALTTVQEGRFVSYGPDVLDKKREIETRWPELECVFDTVDLEWTIMEKTDQGMKLALGNTFKRLDDRVIRRLERADDHATHGIDLIAAVDSHNALIDRDEERALEEIAGDAAERLAHAFKKDGLYDHCDIYGAKPKKGNRYSGAVRTRRTLERHAA